MADSTKKPKEKTSQSTEKQTIFTKETLGVVLILFATLCLVCLITRGSVFSVPGELVNSFLFGCFGYFAYLVMGVVIYLGIVCITGKSLQINGKIKLFAILAIVCLALLLHVITTHGFEGNYGDYLVLSYSKAIVGGIETCSGGGIVVALVAYVFPLILGYVGSYVILSILFAVCVAVIVKTIVDLKKQELVGLKPELRSSFVKNEEIPNANANNNAGVQYSGVKDYPVDVVPPVSSGVQKLFVANPSKDDFKPKPKSKEGEQTVLKVDYTQGGLGVANSSTTYTQGYSNDIQSKIEYVKTPPPINVQNSDIFGAYNSGSYSQSPKNEQPVTNVSDYIPQEPTIPQQPIQEVDNGVNIPLFEHAEAKDDAESHAVRYSELADFDENAPISTSSQPFEEQVTEIVRPMPAQDVYDEQANSQPVNEQEIRHVEEEQDVDIFGNRFNRNVTVEQDVQEEVFEEPIETEPPVSTVTRDRVRNIFFEESEEEKQDEIINEEPVEPIRPSFTSRVEADGNATGLTRRGFEVVEPPREPEPQVEPEKPVKPAPPINREYFRPPFDLLQKYEPSPDAPTENHRENMQIIEQTLADFHINAEARDYVQGPSITRYEITMPAGISVKKVLNYDDDLKMRLSSKEGVRIEAPIPGKNLVGIEIANKVPQTVGLREVMEEAAKEGKAKPGSLIFALGKDIVGRAITDNLAKGPHYLVAGATGSGKSVCLNTMIVSLIMRYSPEELRLFLVDPKGVEFATYEHLPHLMIDEIITSPQKAIEMLKWAYTEMERRFFVFRECNSGIVNIDDYNAMIASDTVAKMPRIVIIIDELADLMQTCKKDLEGRICAIAQKARSAGIHLVLATQRPSVDVITGTIKANLPSRIAFKVMNFADSQTILSEAGAEKLLGNGDMLYKNAQMPGVARYQGAYIHMREVNNVVNYIKEHNTAYFDDELQEFLEKATNPQPEPTVVSEGSNGGGTGANGEHSDLFLRALWFGVNSGTISISSMQRRFGMGFSKAGGIMDKMDRMGLVSPNEGSKARRVLLTREEFEERFGEPPAEQF